MRRLVAGVDSSTQSCKIMIRDADTGALVRSGIARHKSGTEIDPMVWFEAFHEAAKQAGGLEDISALSIAGQQHGLVCIDSDGSVVRKALLWNDVRSAEDAQDLIVEMGEGNREMGAERWAGRIGSVPVASLTISKLRWLAKAEPQHLGEVAAIALPHDWLSWKVSGSTNIEDLKTDRSEASGTGYFDPVSNQYQRDLLKMAGGSSLDRVTLPKVLRPNEAASNAPIGDGLLIGPGAGDNAGAALGLNLRPGELSLSLGTSGVVSLVSTSPTQDPSGMVTGFADARGDYLPLACTLNASRVLDAVGLMLGVDHEGLSRLALSAPPGAEGLVLVPYFDGERTPNLPCATGSMLGITGKNLTPQNIARASIEGVLCSVNVGIEAMRQLGVPVDRINLIGGGSRINAVKRIAPSVLGMPVTVPEFGEYVADGAARQAAWVLHGGETPPEWTPRMSSEFDSRHEPFIVQRYMDACGNYIESQ